MFVLADISPWILCLLEVLLSRHRQRNREKRINQFLSKCNFSFVYWPISIPAFFAASLVDLHVLGWIPAVNCHLRSVGQPGRSLHLGWTPWTLIMTMTTTTSTAIMTTITTMIATKTTSTIKNRIKNNRNDQEQPPKGLWTAWKMPGDEREGWDVGVVGCGDGGGCWVIWRVKISGSERCQRSEKRNDGSWHLVCVDICTISS